MVPGLSNSGAHSHGNHTHRQGPLKPPAARRACAGRRGSPDNPAPLIIRGITGGTANARMTNYQEDKALGLLMRIATGWLIHLGPAAWIKASGICSATIWMVLGLAWSPALALVISLLVISLLVISLLVILSTSHLWPFKTVSTADSLVDYRL